MELPKAIFAGTSHTLGIGLELEFSERFQDDEYLTNVCKQIPPVGEFDEELKVYTEEDIFNQKKYRWSRLVCDKLNLEEVNINDFGGSIYNILNNNRQAVDCVLDLNQKKDNPEVVEILSKTKYIFLEFGYIRWYEQELHGGKDGNKWPSTPAEIINFIERPDIPVKDKEKAIDWVNKVDPTLLWETTLKSIQDIIYSFPDIKFILLGWKLPYSGIETARKFNLDSFFLKLEDDKLIDQERYRIDTFLKVNKLYIKDRVLAFNKKYSSKWLYLDTHACSEGHRIIADAIIKKIANE